MYQHISKLNCSTTCLHLTARFTSTDKRLVTYVCSSLHISIEVQPRRLQSLNHLGGLVRSRGAALRCHFIIWKRRAREPPRQRVAPCERTRSSRKLALWNQLADGNLHNCVCYRDELIRLTVQFVVYLLRLLLLVLRSRAEVNDKNSKPLNRETIFGRPFGQLQGTMCRLSLTHVSWLNRTQQGISDGAVGWGHDEFLSCQQ